MKRILLTLFAIILMVVIFTGCKPINNPECGLFYGDSLELRVGQKVYSCDSAWFRLDSIIEDSRNPVDSSGALVIALSYELYGTQYHRQFSTADTWMDGLTYRGYVFPLVEAYTTEPFISDHDLKVYDIYPRSAMSGAIRDMNYRLSCVFVRDIEG